MSQRTPTRLAAALLLAFCLASGGRAGVGGHADQGFGNTQQRHHSASASSTRVPQARSGHTQGAQDSGFLPGNSAAITTLATTGRVLALGVQVPRSRPIASRSGRSPPRFD